MGWEYRANGRRYLYHNRRVNGKPVKEYMAADNRFGGVLADSLSLLQMRDAEERRSVRQSETALRARIGDLLAATAAANDVLRTVAHGMLVLAGFHKHHRGEWRMRRDLKTAPTPDAQPQAKPAKSNVTLCHQPAAGDAEAVEVFDLARQGDAAAQTRLRGLIRQRGWVDWIGDLGQQTTNLLIGYVTGDDPVGREGVEQKVRALTDELLGTNPSVLERLLVRRVVNGWIAVHALELELAVHPPATFRGREYLEGALGRAQKRMTQAVVELARVRRLQAPRIVAQITAAVPAERPAHPSDHRTGRTVLPAPARAIRRHPATAG